MRLTDLALNLIGVIIAGGFRSEAPLSSLKTFITTLKLVPFYVFEKQKELMEITVSQ